MSSSQAPLLRLPPNRVWRTYLGGRELDRLSGASSPADTHFPEDWIASTTRAVNPPDATRHASAPNSPLSSLNSQFALPEGLSPVLHGSDPTPRNFADVLAADPVPYLGAAHVARYGASPQLLVKFLDPSIRLHFQVHPTAAFAQKFLNAPSGKTEAYHILAIRDDLPHPPYLYLGFQRPPTRDQLRRLIETQDIAGLEACFDKIPVNVGDTLIVPGGVPHALGPGLLLAEIMEPSDLVVRFEFERGGYTLPESARFMNRGLEFCLDVFDLDPWPANRVLTEAFARPVAPAPSAPIPTKTRSSASSAPPVSAFARVTFVVRSPATIRSASSASSPPAPAPSPSAAKLTLSGPSTKFSSLPPSGLGN